MVYKVFQLSKDESLVLNLAYLDEKHLRVQYIIESVTENTHFWVLWVKMIIFFVNNFVKFNFLTLCIRVTVVTASKES